MIPTCEILIGDVRAKLRDLRDRGTRVQCIVTSPPYWALRDYETPPQVWGGREDCEHSWGPAGTLHRGGTQGASGDRSTRDTSAQDAARDVSSGSFCRHCNAWLGQLGLEPTPELHVANQVEVFRLVWDVLAEDGTLWMNFGDSYAGGGNGPTGVDSTLMGNGHQGGGPKRAATDRRRADRIPSARAQGLKPKDMVGIPWRLAFALQADGWCLRQDIIWAKPNPMPESCRDRCTKAHEYLFLLTKSPRYYYDAVAIKERVTGNSHPRGDGVNRKIKMPDGWNTAEGAHGSFHPNGREKGAYRPKQNPSFSAAVTELVEFRNKRSVWTVPTAPYAEAHYATFPPDLIRPCILAGSRPGDTVLDPFGGSGTTASVAMEYGRNAIMIDLNPANERLMRDRIAPHAGQGVLAIA
ncbi:MAG TPA: site-specific DNA-methyltransferase [Candidatus Synoicihabitans sp.]|nr:site-specific DNA-methyltransferase [Candidatus Synoicihabitans sp.]